MKYITFGKIDSGMRSVLKNIPYPVEYIITNERGYEEFDGRKVYTSSKLFQEQPDNIFVFITDMEHYAELADQMTKMGFSEGKHFAGAIEYLYNQWENNEYFDDFFTVRIKHMTNYISEESRSVLDLGCGTRELEKFLTGTGNDKEPIEYWGADYADRGDGTIICDFNKGEFPDKEADTVFCSGCLEYMEDVDGFLRKMCRSGRKEIVLSYCPLEYKNDILQRRQLGWKNHLTISSLVRKMKIFGYSLCKAEKSIGCNVIFKFINERQKITDLIQDRHLTYLEEDALTDLMEAVAVTNSLSGCIIETGCALGGSGICIAWEKDTGKPLYIYDVFDMIPAPGEKDGKDVLDRYDVIRQGKSQGIVGDLYYGYRENLIESVKNNFCDILGIGRLQDRSIELVKGLFQDTLLCKHPVALAHIDCDWYDSVMVCLERIVPQLVPGGILVIDDYYHWSGCREAVDEYFKDKKESFIFEKKSRLHITKKQRGNGAKHEVWFSLF